MYIASTYTAYVWRSGKIHQCHRGWFLRTRENQVLTKIMFCYTYFIETFFFKSHLGVCLQSWPCVRSRFNKCRLPKEVQNLCIMSQSECHTFIYFIYHTFNYWCFCYMLLWIGLISSVCNQIPAVKMPVMPLHRHTIIKTKKSPYTLCTDKSGQSFFSFFMFDGATTQCFRDSL